MFEEIIIYCESKYECDMYIAYKFEEDLAICNDGGFVFIARLRQEINSNLKLYKMFGSEILSTDCDANVDILKHLVFLLYSKNIYDLLMTRIDLGGLEEVDFGIDRLLSFRHQLPPRE
ncbi:hypothetical protein NL868_001336 [Shigella flexneri]|nr:hypothetical protein [Shigella flexneri]